MTLSHDVSTINIVLVVIIIIITSNVFEIILFSGILWVIYPIISSLEVCQNFQEALSTLRSVGVAHWVHAVASALGVCFAGIHAAGKVR